MQFSNDFTKMLNLRYPLVMAPMFLVSNETMIRKGVEAGVLACFPALNYRKEEELTKVIRSLNELIAVREGAPGNYGMNIIVQKSNPLLEMHVRICNSEKVPVVITSLGNPSKVIEAVHGYGGKVFCDVTNIAHARKCHSAGCDGFVAIGQGAGGHAGPFPLMVLIDALKKVFPRHPVLAGGGVANGKTLLSVLAGGADAGYCGTRFVASVEAPVAAEYKDAILTAGMNDIVLTEKISGTPCTIINTPFARKIGTEQGWFEKLLSKNPKTRKYFKMLIQRRGFKWLEDAVKPGNYNNLWCAGQSVELIHSILPVSEIIEQMMAELMVAKNELERSFAAK